MKIEQLPVSVIIVNHNAGQLLLDCVRTTLAQAVQVIVVDNSSSDQSMAWLRECFPFEPRLVTHELNKNLGFAAGCNVGIGFAKQPYLLFLNPDSLLGDESLARMVQALESDASVGMVGGLLTNLDGSEQGGGRRAVPTPWRSFVRAFGLTRYSNRWPRLFYDFHLHKQPLPEHPIEVEAISGALMLVRRSAMEEVGYWDDQYFLHCEDLDWCMRFRQHGWKIMFVPDAPVVHHHGHCGRSKPVFVEWHKHKGMAYFYRKFFRHQYPGGMMVLVNTGVWLRFGMVATYHTMSGLRDKVQGARFKSKGIKGKERRLHNLERRVKLSQDREWFGYDRRLLARERREGYVGEVGGAHASTSSARTEFNGGGAHASTVSARAEHYAPSGSAQVDISNTPAQSSLGLLGASSFVGGRIIPALVSDKNNVLALTRKPVNTKIGKAVNWRQLTNSVINNIEAFNIEKWISLMPIWMLPEYFAMLERYGVKKVVALSSTSRFTKVNSSSAIDRKLAADIAKSEDALIKWAEQHGVEWVIIRPTMIYGYGQDKNITEIANLIRRFGFIPLLGKASGARQPVHVEDVAAACRMALSSPLAKNKAYNISGAETLSYKEMVNRIFAAMNRRPRYISIPMRIFYAVVMLLKIFPRYRKLSIAVAERMNQDMVFDHDSAGTDLGFKPRPFKLTAADVVESAGR